MSTQVQVRQLDGKNMTFNAGTSKQLYDEVDSTLHKRMKLVQNGHVLPADDKNLSTTHGMFLRDGSLMALPDDKGMHAGGRCCKRRKRRCRRSSSYIQVLGADDYSDDGGDLIVFGGRRHGKKTVRSLSKSKSAARRRRNTTRKSKGRKSRSRK